MIAGLAQLDLLKRLGAMPVEPLLEALRDLHQRGATDSPQLQALLAPRRQATPQPAPAAVELRRPSGGADYEVARKHFVEHAQRLREQALLAERLLDGLVRGHSATASALHQEMTMDCRPDAVSSMRFLIVNSLDRAVLVSFRPGQAHGRAETRDLSSLVSFDPPAPRLQPREEATIRLSLDLSGQQSVADTIEFGVDVLGDERLLVKLWVRACVKSQEAGSGTHRGRR